MSFSEFCWTDRAAGRERVFVVREAMSGVSAKLPFVYLHASGANRCGYGGFRKFAAGANRQAVRERNGHTTALPRLSWCSD